VLNPYSTVRQDELLGEVQIGKFDLSLIPGFPEAEFHERRMLYADLMQWYTGFKLEEQQVQGGRTVEKYPIKLNPIRGAVYKHAYALFGEVKDDSRPLAPPIFSTDDKKDAETAKNGQAYLNNLWYENSGRSLMLSNAILSQVLGGCVFRLAYVPEQKWRRIPLRIEDVHPSNFVGLPMSGDQFRLSEAWIVKSISQQEAFRVYGMTFDVPPDELLYYVEYWNPDEYQYTINGHVIPSTKRANGKIINYEGKNMFGGVPIVYIPHIRAGNFYGDSLVSKNVQGIVEELNKRVADYGDAVSDDSHRYYVVKNVSGRPDVYELAPGIRVVQLPSNPSITGKEGDPDMRELGAPQASTAMRELNEQLYEQFRREAFIPAVADGEDEGSQRSALTLAMRMWPLLSHTSMERIYWGDGLALLDEMAVKIGLAQGFSIDKLSKDLLDMRIERRWAPMLPRDQEVFINELVNRASANLGSIKHLLTLLDDIYDPDGEYEEIKAQLKEMAEIDQQAMQKAFEQRAFQSGQGTAMQANKKQENK